MSKRHPTYDRLRNETETAKYDFIEVLVSSVPPEHQPAMRSKAYTLLFALDRFHSYSFQSTIEEAAKQQTDRVFALESGQQAIGTRQKIHAGMFDEVQKRLDGLEKAMRLVLKFLKLDGPPRLDDPHDDV